MILTREAANLRHSSSVSGQLKQTFRNRVYRIILKQIDLEEVWRNEYQIEGKVTLIIV